MATPPLLIPNLALNSIGLVQLVSLWVSAWEVVRSYPISLPMLEYVKWCGPTRSPCTCWSVLGVVQPDHPTFPAFGLATFNQPPFSFLLPSWDLMIPHGSGQRMTRKHSSSPIVAGGNSGGNPTVRRIHGPTSRLYRYYDTLFMTILYYDHSM